MRVRLRESSNFMNNDSTPRILIAEDELDVRNYFTVALRCQGYCAEFADGSDDAVKMLRQGSARYAALLIDLNERQTIRQTIRQARALDAGLPIIVVADA